MSWSTSTPVPVTRHEIQPGAFTPADLEGEGLEQFDAAVYAARGVAVAVGRPGDLLRVSISGHANPDHAPTDGYADETVTVSVAVVHGP